MKQVIEGKLYDTETATEICRRDNGRGNGDFSYVREALYRTKKGRFFLAGEGGAMTHYAERCGQNCWSEGRKIIPQDIEGAKRWMEMYGTADKYIELFGAEEA